MNTHNRSSQIKILEKETEKLKRVILEEAVFILLSEILEETKLTESFEPVSQKVIKFCVERLDERKTVEILDICSELPRPKSILSSRRQCSVRKQKLSVNFPESDPHQSEAIGATSLNYWRQESSSLAGGLDRDEHIARHCSSNSSW